MEDTGQRPTASVVIVNWNAGDALARCLRSIHDHAPKVPFEVIVVDNASRDGSAQRAVHDHPSIRLIPNTTNRGLPAANNQGIVASRAPYIVVSNPDVVYRPGTLDAFVNVMERRPRAGLVVPRMHYEDGALHTSAGELPSLSEALLGRQLQRRLSPGAAGCWWDGWAHDTECRIGRGHEASYVVRRSAIETVGLQDERYLLDWEGADWFGRMTAAGWEAWFTPTAEVVHLGGASIRQAPARWIVSSHRGMYRYFATRHPAWRPWLAPVVTARAAAKLTAHALRRDVYEAGHRGTLRGSASKAMG